VTTSPQLFRALVAEEPRGLRRGGVVGKEGSTGRNKEGGGCEGRGGGEG
jgi:hypothetical protein